MTQKTRLWLTLAICLSLSLAFTARGRAAERLTLDHATVVADADQPSFVQYGIEELVSYLKDATGNAISVVASMKDAKGMQILVGTKMAQQVLGEDLSTEQLGVQGYLLKSLSKEGTQYLVVTGATPHGTKAALSGLMKAIQVENKSAFVPTPIDRLQKPPIAKRGMHFNGWAFNPPYSFRDWSEQEWQKYLDVLAYQGVNLFYLWPFIEIMPVPLSPEDQSYLEECRRVVDYAQKTHGMEVWIMQCTNRVAKDDCGVKEPRRRPYWRKSQEDLNPGNPEHFKAIVASRDAMYQIINNVDGVCNIDSDPGYFPHSPLSEYLQVLNACRDSLNRHNIHGKETKIISWMWEGWGLVPGQLGSKTRDLHEIETIQALKQGLPQPWGLVAGRGADLRLCRQENLLPKTMFLPYGAMEGEPAYPTTNVTIDAIRQLFATHVVRNPELEGMMGNLQTPHLQFPHMYYFTSSMNDTEFRQQSERDVLLDVSSHLYPEQKQLLADCYLALKETDPAKVQFLADQLDTIVKQDKLGTLGIFGRKLFPDHKIVAKILVYQLKLRAATERLALGFTPTTSKKDCEKLLFDYFDAYLAWDAAHGWHDLWGWKDWPIDAFKTDPRFSPVAQKLFKILGDKSSVDECFAAVASQLANHNQTALETGCIAPFKKAVLSTEPIATLAQKATATASALPDPKKYPASAGNDGFSATEYWPGALIENNTEWFQLKWDQPQTVSKVVVRFIQHPSIRKRTIHLQREVASDKWEDIATTTVSANAKAPQAVATFQLPDPVSLDKLRIVNLLDLFEIEVY